MINITFLKIMVTIVLVLSYLLTVFNDYMNKKRIESFINLLHAEHSYLSE